MFTVEIALYVADSFKIILTLFLFVLKTIFNNIEIPSGKNFLLSNTLLTFSYINYI